VLPAGTERAPAVIVDLADPLDAGDGSTTLDLEDAYHPAASVEPRRIRISPSTAIR
jgi:hypothetical protein